MPSLLDLLTKALPLPAGAVTAAQRRSSGARASPARAASPAPHDPAPYSFLRDLRAAAAGGMKQSTQHGGMGGHHVLFG